MFRPITHFVLSAIAARARQDKHLNDRGRLDCLDYTAFDRCDQEEKD
jgi:uncharacterized protein YuzB (UPF0349 family)